MLLYVLLLYYYIEGTKKSRQQEGDQGLAEQNPAPRYAQGENSPREKKRVLMSDARCTITLLYRKFYFIYIYIYIYERQY